MWFVTHALAEIPGAPEQRFVGGHRRFRGSSFHLLCKAAQCWRGVFNKKNKKQYYNLAPPVVCDTRPCGDPRSPRGHL